MKTRLLTTLTAALLALSAWANGTKINGIYYLLDNSTKTASVTYTGNGFNGDLKTLNPNSTAYKGRITIPTSVSYHRKTYSVTSIGETAFAFCTRLTSITIPSSVTSIGGAAFAFCAGLTSVTIPNSVTSIEDNAFANCTGLTSVTIPNSVTSIGDGAFIFCSGLTSITIPSSVTRIREKAFGGCTGLTSVTIPNSVTSIGNEAFARCTGLTSVTIGNSVTSIGARAFEDCNDLTNVTALHTNPEAYNCAYDAFLTDNFTNLINDGTTLHVPAGCKTAYRNCWPWMRFGTIIDDAQAQ